MKRYLLSLGIILSLSVINACNDAPEGDKATISEKETAAEISGRNFKVDTTTSFVRFTGRGVGKNHPGKFKLSSGTVGIENNQLTGGSFNINIKSMQMEEQNGGVQGKLRPHLLSGDFFDADKFGEAKFSITSVQPYKASDKDTSIVDGANFTISGNLTIKDVTKNVSFPARVDLDENELKAKANFNIDRTQWKINYGNDKTLGDNFISETVNIELDLLARKL